MEYICAILLDSHSQKVHQDILQVFENTETGGFLLVRLFQRLHAHADFLPVKLILGAFVPRNRVVDRVQLVLEPVQHLADPFREIGRVRAFALHLSVLLVKRHLDAAFLGIFADQIALQSIIINCGKEAIK